MVPINLNRVSKTREALSFDLGTYPIFKLREKLPMNDLQTTKTLSIRELGKDEFWLRDKIYDDPTILGLGNLEAVTKEKNQPQGGRLDLLLKNPDDDSMYEVEIQLGATDETHIIRTIEYWESEKRRWPRRSHTAVLVAETITNRFFNVVSLLSQAVPIIGIQVNVVQVEDKCALHFSKVIDSYEEPEDIDSGLQVFDESHWREQSPGGLESAKRYQRILENLYGEVPIKYFAWYITLAVGGRARVWVNYRANNRAFFEVYPVDERYQECVERVSTDGTFRVKRSTIAFNTNVSELQTKVELHRWLAAQLAPAAVKSA